MSLRRHVLRVLALATAVAFCFGAFAGVAGAKKLSKKQKAAVTKKLRKQVKKNPRAIKRKSFLKTAAAVDFKLPVTIRLRGSNTTNPFSPVYAASNPNSANADLGATLGSRAINLGGTLPAEIQFADAYDGGALGNVRLELLPGGTGGLTTTSIPLLWNSNVSDNSGTPNAGTKPWYGVGDDALIEAGFPPPGSTLDDGCMGFYGASNLGYPPLAPFAGAGYDPTLGIPIFKGAAEYGAFASLSLYGASGGLAGTAPQGGVNDAGTTLDGYYPEVPGVDSLDNIQAGPGAPTEPGNENNLGSNPNPFGFANAGFAPGNPNYNDAEDVVLRTSDLNLKVATPGTEVSQVADTVGVDGGENLTIGKSGGTANLFGDIPGKAYGIDVTVSLATQINSIFRAVDVDAEPLITGTEWPPAAFNCRQAWTGKVDNYFAGVRLKGDLKISPAITKDGKLRIAKATLSSQQPTPIAVAACLYPHSVYAAEANGTDAAPVNVPTPPIDEANKHPKPTVDCKTGTTALVDAAGTGNLTTLLPTGAPYTTAADGSRVSVSGTLDVTNVSADILIGQNQ